MLANFGRNAEAIERLENLVIQYPDFYNAQLVLGGIHQYQGNSDKASECFRSAVSNANTLEERSVANSKWREVNLNGNQSRIGTL